MPQIKFEIDVVCRASNKHKVADALWGPRKDRNDTNYLKDVVSVQTVTPDEKSSDGECNGKEPHII